MSRRVTDEDRARWQAMRGNGLTDGQIAEAAGVHPRTVGKHLGPGGVRAPQVRADDDESHEMWRLHTSGVPQSRIATQYGISQQAVSQRLDRYRRTLPPVVVDTIARRELDFLEQLRGRQLAIAADTNAAAADRLTAMRDATRGMERLARMLGLDAADKRDERRVALAEEQGRLVADVIRRVLERIGVDHTAPGVREVVHGELLRLVDPAA